jgi:hypothetical protein
LNVAVLHNIAVSFGQEHRDDPVFFFEKYQYDARAMTCFDPLSMRDPVAFVMAQGRNTHGKTGKGLLKLLDE